MTRVLLAMSGGVDSSVAAHLLCEQGHEVIGVFMRHGVESPVACETSASPQQAGVAGGLPIINPRLDHKQGCCTAADAADARRVADHLNIPFYALNLEEEFNQIIDYFVAEYTAGRTPNPCVQCNNWIKFGKLFEYADSVGAEYVATGHYARMEHRDGEEPGLYRGVDDGKDQAYVLYGIERSLLSRMMLPIGQFQKSRIREMATEYGLRVADKRDSQEICFVTSGEHDEFVRARRAAGEEPEQTTSTAGIIVTTDGQEVGQHSGIEGFTVGQRKGLGGGFREPHFVVRIDASTNQVVIGQRADLACQQLIANQTNWLVDPPNKPQVCQAQIRYNSRPRRAIVEVMENRRMTIRFDEPVEGIAPGQAVVCFAEDRVLGGGWIESSS